MATPPELMNLLTFTTLYPNAKQPSHGIFVETRLAHLVASGRARSRVVAPVPYVPDFGIVPKAYRHLRSVPDVEERRGIEVHHPRYFLIPKASMLWAPLSLYLVARSRVSRLLREGGEFDLIDAHYFYPDGIAAILLGRHFGKPVVITARGTDINLIPQYRLPRAMIRWAAARSDGMITVCAALKDALVDLGAPAEKIRVLRNGVDLVLFRPADREACRAKLGLTATTLLSVGHLIPRKGHDLIIRALQGLPGMHLVIVGSGPQEAELKGLAASLGVAERVRFLGALPQSRLSELYSAADLLVLASSREGWANVLLEAMACGTPVVASNVWGTPEVVAAPEVGELLAERTPQAIAHSVRWIIERKPDRRAIRTYAERFSWDATTAGQLELFQDILRKHRTCAGAATAIGTRLETARNE